MNLLKNLFALTFITTTLLGCATSKYSTSDEYIPLYEDKVSEGFKLIKTWRDYSVEEKNGVLIYRQYIMETRQLYHQVTLKKANLEKHGEELEWYGNGNLRSKGENLNGEKNGLWEYYSFEKGALEEYGRYLRGEKKGIWTFVDSLGNKTASFSYLNDELNGKFVLYSKNGEIYKEGIYNKGKLTRSKKLIEVDFHPQEITEKEFKLISCDNAGKGARKQCRKNNLDFAARSIADYPDFERERKVTGTALIYIEIDEEGEISEFKILRSMSQNFSNEIEKLKDIDFVFEPALSDGKPYKTSHIITLAYFPPEGTYYHDPFMFNNFFLPPPPSFTPPSF